MIDRRLDTGSPQGLDDRCGRCPLRAGALPKLGVRLVQPPADQPAAMPTAGWLDAVSTAPKKSAFPNAKTSPLAAAIQ